MYHLCHQHEEDLARLAKEEEERRKKAEEERRIRIERGLETPEDLAGEDGREIYTYSTVLST